MRRGSVTALLLIVVLNAAFIASLRLAGSKSTDEAVIALGQDELLAEMLGKGEPLVGCEFAGGNADGGAVRARYTCPAGTVVFQITHPSVAPRGATLTDRFAISLQSGSPPGGLAATLAARIRAREAAFQWTWLDKPRAGVHWSIVLAAVALFATAALAWTARTNVLSVWRLPLQPGVGLALSLCGTALGILLLEVAVRLSGTEGRLAASVLYLQGADLAVHRVSDDPFLHYELAPGTHLVGKDLRESPYRESPYTVNIDSFGARRPTHAPDKLPGTFRVLCFGGSTMYGAAVDDEQTIPARLETHLNGGSHVGDSLPTRFEVWNFGTSAYTLGQAAHLAKRKLLELDPDLIVVQHHNRGRRAFLAAPGGRVADHPEELQHPGVDFLLEHFSVPSGIPIRVQEALTYSALYRSLTALAQRLPGRNTWSCDRCDEMSTGKARELSRESEPRGIPVVYVAIPADSGRFTPADIFPELAPGRFIDLFRPGRELQFYDVHPPASVLDEYAALLAAALRERGLLSSR